MDWEVKLKRDSSFLKELSKEYCSPELLFYSDSQLDWFSLFMIYETIRDDPMYADSPIHSTRDGIKRIEESISEIKNDGFS